MRKTTVVVLYTFAILILMVTNLSIWLTRENMEFGGEYAMLSLIGSLLPPEQSLFI